MTPFDGATTAREVVAAVDLAGRHFLITGASSGIGLETARALVNAGGSVTLAVRDLEAGVRVAERLGSGIAGQRLSVLELDLADRSSIARLVAAWDRPISALILNAGIMACPETRTPEGVEMQFAVNHLGHFALAIGLQHALAAAGTSRIVSVSSSAHMRSPVVFDDIQFRFRRYDPLLAYGQSKTANILFAVGADERWSGEGIVVNAAMPGAVATKLHRYSGGELMRPAHQRKTPAQGAATPVFLAASPLSGSLGGRYFHDCRQAQLLTARSSDMTGVAPYALDRDNADRLWAESLRLLDLA